MPARPRPLSVATRSFAAGTVLVLALQACGETTTQVGEADVVELRVTPDTTLLGIGRTLQFRAFALDATGAAITGIEFSWSSSDAGLATVDDAGLASGLADGAVEITAAAAGLVAAASVTVAPPPSIALSAPGVSFSADAGGTDPAPDTLQVTNGGAFTLEGLAIDSVVYGAGADAWLTPALLQTAAPASLTLEASVAGVTTAGSYAASVWLSGLDAEPAAVSATLDVGAGPASQTAVNDGDGQAAAVGTAVPIAPSVLVTDAFGNPVASTQVTFTVTGGGGSVSGATVATDASGVARVGSWTLGTAAGANELTATPAGLTAVTFSATGTPAAPASIQIAAGDGQSAVAGAAVAVRPSVSVLDSFGNGVPGVTVTFAVTSGGGSVGGGAQSTDASGMATVGSWTLGTTAGSNTLGVTAAGVSGSVTITATGISGSAVAIQLEGGDAQTDTVGATLPTPYAVKIVDVNGNGVAGITVSWGATSGGGSMPSTSVTGADGVATAQRTLGTTAGQQLAEGGVGGLTGSPVVFSATATAGAAAVLVEIEGDGQSSTVGTPVSTDPRVRVEDQFGNPVAGHAVTFAVTAGGGSVDPASATLTDAQGEAVVVSWTLGTTAGTNGNTLTATASGAGLAGNPATFTASGTPDVPAAVTVDAATDGQTAVTGNNVANPPAVTVTDQYGNTVPGATVDFAPSGSGLVAGAASTSVVTNASGRATTTWTVDVGGHVLQSDGTFPNALTATVQGTAISGTFAADAIYSYVTHVNPLWAGCTGCHQGATPPASLALDGDAATNYAALYNAASQAACAAGFVRISPIAGVSAEDASQLLRYVGDGFTVPTGCFHPVRWDNTTDNTTIVRAWVRNGAPSN